MRNWVTTAPHLSSILLVNAQNWKLENFGKMTNFPMLDIKLLPLLNFLVFRLPPSFLKK